MKRRRLNPTLLKWILLRRGRLLTCQLDRNGNGYCLSVLPSGQPERRLVELLDAATTAFQRHAAVVANLRDNGWTTVAYR